MSLLGTVTACTYCPSALRNATVLMTNHIIMLMTADHPVFKPYFKCLVLLIFLINKMIDIKNWNLENESMLITKQKDKDELLQAEKMLHKRRGT